METTQRWEETCLPKTLGVKSFMDRQWTSTLIKEKMTRKTADRSVHRYLLRSAGQPTLSHRNFWYLQVQRGEVEATKTIDYLANYHYEPERINGGNRTDFYHTARTCWHYNHGKEARYVFLAEEIQKKVLSFNKLQKQFFENSAHRQRSKPLYARLNAAGEARNERSGVDLRHNHFRKSVQLIGG